MFSDDSFKCIDGYLVSKNFSSSLYPYVFHARFSNLSPQSNYEYYLKQLNPESDTWVTSSFYSFWTTPSIESKSKGSYFIIGDMGRFGGAPTLYFLEDIFKKRNSPENYKLRNTGSNDLEPFVNAIIHIGDFAYDLQDENGQNGDAFMSRIVTLAAFVP